MKTLFGRLLAAGLLALSAVTTPVMAGGYGKQKVVYHVNDINAAAGALRNVANHLNALGDANADIVVVTHSSGGLTLVEGSTDAKGRSFDATVQTLASRGVKFQLCSNTIEGLKIDRDKINLVAEIVPAGVAQIAKLQQEGYVYLKP